MADDTDGWLRPEVSSGFAQVKGVRQRHQCPELGERKLRHDSAVLSIGRHVIPGLSPAVLGARPGTVAAVSYTHLDVYKRQDHDTVHR